MKCPALMCLGLAWVTSCTQSGEPSGPSGPRPAEISLDFDRVSAAVGQAVELRAIVKDSSGGVLQSQKIQWSADNQAVIAVKPGDSGATLTGVSAGTSQVRATVGSISATVTVTVAQFAAIKPGVKFSCAITTDGKLYCAGSQYGAGAIPVAPELRFVSISLGRSGTDEACGITVDRAAFCWGSNDKGQLGAGDFSSHVEPTPVTGGHRFASISVGRFHVCAITLEADAYCWGDGSEGRLGTGGTDVRNSPARVQVPADEKLAQIEAGANATCAVATSGQAYCWGRNDLGQLGSSQAVAGHLGDFSLLPVPVDNAASTAQVVTEGPKSCLLDSSGHAFCYGNNTVLELGSGISGPDTRERCYTDKPCSTTPLPVATNASFVSLAASQFATCGLTATKKIFCWGMDFELLFGSASGGVPACETQGATYPCSSTPIAGPDGFTTISLSITNQCGLRDDRIAYCWGGNANGQRGWPGATPDNVPHVFALNPKP